jgi:hypothetical protein
LQGFNNPVAFPQSVPANEACLKTRPGKEKERVRARERERERKREVSVVVVFFFTHPQLQLPEL